MHIRPEHTFSSVFAFPVSHACIQKVGKKEKKEGLAILIIIKFLLLSPFCAPAI